MLPKGEHVNLGNRIRRWTIHWLRAIWVWIWTRWKVSKLLIQKGQLRRVIILRDLILGLEWQLRRWAGRNSMASTEICHRLRRKSNVGTRAQTYMLLIDWHRPRRISASSVFSAHNTMKKRMTEVWVYMNDRRRYKAWNANTASESSTKKLEIAI